MVVAAFAQWHPGHLSALEVMKGAPKIPAHCAMESYSVLTRLPAPYRVSPATAFAYLDQWFSQPLLTLAENEVRGLLRRLADATIAGGAVYDGLVGTCAAANGCRLVTRDRRAAVTYERLGVSFDLLD
ncbi:MAG: type II toxin-antitoxin system VapC family toxin [Acidimicrobiales bacterium]